MSFTPHNHYRPFSYNDSRPAPHNNTRSDGYNASRSVSYNASGSDCYSRRSHWYNTITGGYSRLNNSKSDRYDTSSLSINDPRSNRYTTFMSDGYKMYKNFIILTKQLVTSEKYKIITNY